MPVEAMADPSNNQMFHESPPKRQRESPTITDALPDDPNAALDALIARNNAASLPGAPEWAVELHKNILAPFAVYANTVNQRLSALESANQSTEMGERLQRLEEIVLTMQASGGGNSSGPPRSSAYPAGPYHAAPRDVQDALPSNAERLNHHSRAQGPATLPRMGHDMNQFRTSSASLQQSPASQQVTDYNHVVIGGWPDGTKRDEILKSAKVVLEKFQPSLDRNVPS